VAVASATTGIFFGSGRAVNGTVTVRTPFWKLAWASSLLTPSPSAIWRYRRPVNRSWRT
jgi:hypothetical protein